MLCLYMQSKGDKWNVINTHRCLYLVFSPRNREHAIAKPASRPSGYVPHSMLLHVVSKPSEQEREIYEGKETKKPKAMRRSSRVSSVTDPQSEGDVNRQERRTA